MSRQKEHDELTGKDKEKIFRAAYGNVKQFIGDKNYIAANVLAFALLEDRVHATWAFSKMIKFNSTKLTPREVNRNRFSETIKDLQKWGVIADELAQELHTNAHERNRLTHEMIWRLDSFTEKSAVRSVRLSRMVDKALREFNISFYKDTSSD